MMYLDAAAWVGWKLLLKVTAGNPREIQSCSHLRKVTFDFHKVCRYPIATSYLIIISVHAGIISL